MELKVVLVPPEHDPPDLPPDASDRVELVNALLLSLVPERVGPINRSPREDCEAALEDEEEFTLCECRGLAGRA